MFKVILITIECFIKNIPLLKLYVFNCQALNFQLINLSLYSFARPKLFNGNKKNKNIEAYIFVKPNIMHQEGMVIMAFTRKIYTYNTKKIHV